MSAGWRYAKQRRAAREATRRQERGRSRDELRALYESELAKRGITDQQSSTEASLDQLTRSRSEQLQAGVEGLRALGQAGAGIIRAFKTLTDDSGRHGGDRTFRVGRVGQLSGQDVPQRWRLPAHAAYPVHLEEPGRAVGVRWLPAAMDPAAPDVIDAVVSQPSVTPAATSLAGWLSPDPDGGLSVHVGDRRVGRLAGADAEAYRQDIELAGSLDLAPVVQVRLVRRRQPPLHLVEVNSP